MGSDTLPFHMKRNADATKKLATLFTGFDMLQVHTVLAEGDVTGSHSTG